jgi:hypothetical protein
MSESTAEFFQTLARVLLRSWVMAYLLLFVWLGFYLLAPDVIYRLHGGMFTLSPHEIDLIFYCGMGLYKLFVLVFLFFPWLSIWLVLRNAKP